MTQRTDDAFTARQTWTESSRIWLLVDKHAAQGWGSQTTREAAPKQNAMTGGMVHDLDTKLTSALPGTE
jgi:hypothetical protein